MPDGMSREPDLTDPTIVWVDRAIKALIREFSADPKGPRFVVVVETPPDGRIGIASTGDDDVDTHRMLTLGASSVRHGMSDADRRRARRFWDKAEAEFRATGATPPFKP